MKKLCIILLMSILLCGCFKMSETYQFSNPLEEIVSIELIHNRSNNGRGINPDDYFPIKTLGEKEVHDFMSEVYSLPTRTVGTPPPFGYGEYIAKVTYTNGDIEMLNTNNIEFIPSGSNPTGVGEYFFVGNDFEELILRYSDENN